MSATGNITFGAVNSITLGNYPGVPGSIIAITMSAGAPAIHMGSANAYTVTGSMYAPLGQIMSNGGGTGVNTFNGKIVGREIFMALSAGSTWNFSGGGPSGGTWSLYQ